MEITFGSRISAGVSGETSSCSMMVPRSFSRTAAAAASMMASTVMTVSNSEMGMNQVRSQRCGISCWQQLREQSLAALPAE